MGAFVKFVRIFLDFNIRLKKKKWNKKHWSLIKYRLWLSKVIYLWTKTVQYDIWKVAKSTLNLCFRYLVWPPLCRNTDSEALLFKTKVLINPAHRPGGISADSSVQNSFTSGSLVGFPHMNCLHNISIGLRSGLWLGRYKTFILFFFNHLLVCLGLLSSWTDALTSPFKYYLEFTVPSNMANKTQSFVKLPKGKQWSWISCISTQSVWLWIAGVQTL